MTDILAKYFDYANVFSLDLTIELPENTKINEYAIKLINRKELLYKPIYALNLMELEMLKTYIKSYLKMGFIQPSKSLAKAFIFFDKKPDNNFRLSVNYQGLHNFRIENQYLLSLIGESLDRLSQAMQFT